MSGASQRLPLRRIGFRNGYLYLLIGAFFISSDDTVFVVNVPFALRLSIIMLAGFIVIGLVKMTQQVRVMLPHGYLYLLAWSAFGCLALMCTPVLYFSAVQTAFFLFDVLLVLVVCNTVTRRNFAVIFQFYLMSFGFMAAYGLFQIAASLVGIHIALQYWTPHFARINGLSYEPSYYAIYLGAGLVTLGYLKYKRVTEFKRIDLYYNLTLAAMILSSSRTGISLVAIWYARLLPAQVASLLRGKLKRRAAFGLAGAAVFLVLAAGFVIEAGPQRFLFLLSGTGLYGTAAQSYDDRSDWASQTWEVFLQHPILGVGIGGINYYATIIRHGLATQDSGILKASPGANITAEILTSVGLAGSIFVALYFISLGVKAYRMRREYPVVLALALGLLAELYLLQFSQDIERIYLWLHIAMLSAAIGVYGQIDRARRRTELVGRSSPA